MLFPIEIQVAIIAAFTSTIITPLVQLGISILKREHDYQGKIAPIIEHVRVLRNELLQVPLNPNMDKIIDRIEVIEQFYDPVFISLKGHYIKSAFIRHAKDLEERHKHPRPWGQLEYPQECEIFINASERFLAVLNKEKNIPKLFNPSE